MTPQSVVADAVELSKAQMARYLAGFDDSSSLRQAENLPNHPRWCLGHCALTMHRVAEMLDGRSAPDTDFATGGPQPGRFHTEAVAFGSKPAGSTETYPPLARCVEIYNAACDRLASAVRAATEARLMEQVDWLTFKMPLYILVIRMCSHNGFHTGQIADLRRALKFKSIFA
jgi:hypothetical protein